METSDDSALKKEIVDISRRCGSQGWCPIMLGNVSTLNPSRDRVYIKASGADMNRLELKNILTLDLDGNVLEGKGKPSIEVNFHLGI